MKHSIKRLRELLKYDPETGKLYWKPRPGNTRFNNHYAGKEALIHDVDGYRRGLVEREQYYAHRVAWALYYGRWPTRRVDHINNDRADNRIENLRLVSAQQNSRNMKAPSRNKSGVKGVRFCEYKGKWVALIGVNYRNINLGHYDNKAEAVAARNAAERVLAWKKA